MHFNGWSKHSSPGDRLIGNNIRAWVTHSRLADVVWLVGRVFIRVPSGFRSLSEKRPGEEASLRRRRCIIASLILLDKYTVLLPRVYLTGHRGRGNCTTAQKPFNIHTRPGKLAPVAINLPGYPVEYAPRMFRDEHVVPCLFLVLERYYPYLDSFVYVSVSRYIGRSSFLCFLHCSIFCEFAKLILVLVLIECLEAICTRQDLSFLIRFGITEDRLYLVTRIIKIFSLPKL